MNDPTCRDVLDFLDDYLAGDQPEAVRARFQAHLDRCPPCADYLRTYADVRHLTRSLCEAGGELPARLPEDLVAAIVAAMKQSE